jgi:hypothetical protein
MKITADQRSSLDQDAQARVEHPCNAIRDSRLGWAIFLGCSWTWCIGMFLPVLLVRELGIWGWIVFAIPNVIGAAAMGWVLRNPDSSRRIVEKHAAACRAFSAVTIAFHVFFLLWFVPRLIGLPAAAGAFALVVLYLLLTLARPVADLFIARAVFLISLWLFVMFLEKRLTTIPLSGSHPTIDAVFLAPACILGFALCPYLDLTFHRARQSLADRKRSRIAFGLGFGVIFFSMIVFSLCYATALSPLIAPDWGQHLRPAFGWVIGFHMILQAAFTLAIHARSLAESRIRPGGIFALLLLAQIAIFAALASPLLPRWFDLDPGELVYRLFMSFYGLVFPAYVWICMLPGRGDLSAASLRALILALFVAAPCFWLGFIADHMIWLLPGVLAVVLARFFVPGRDSGEIHEIVTPSTGEH